MTIDAAHFRDKVRLCLRLAEALPWTVLRATNCYCWLKTFNCEKEKLKAELRAQIKLSPADKGRMDLFCKKRQGSEATPV